MADNSHGWFTPVQISGFKLPGLPLTPKGIRERARKLGWPRRRVAGRGGRDGLRDEYQPPEDIQAQIVSRQNERTAFYRSNEGLRHLVAESPNPEKAYEAQRVIRDAADTLQRLKAEAGFQYTPEWGALLLELLASGQITEGVARLIINRLKSDLKGDL